LIGKCSEVRHYSYTRTVTNNARKRKNKISSDSSVKDKLTANHSKDRLQITQTFSLTRYLFFYSLASFINLPTHIGTFAFAPYTLADTHGKSKKANLADPL